MSMLHHPALRNFFVDWRKDKSPFRAYAAAAQACSTCNGQRRTFACPRWPVCGCPEGAVDPACPGKSVACSCPPQGAAGSC